MCLNLASQRAQLSFNFPPPSSVAVNQDYLVDVFRATVINGNDALLKCDVPSFVSDFVSVDGWVDSQGNNILPNTDSNDSNNNTY